MIVIGISGKAESGKDTFMKLVIEKYEEITGNKLVYEQVRFADKLKEAAALIFGLTWNEMETPEGKRQKLYHFPVSPNPRPGSYRDIWGWIRYFWKRLHGVKDIERYLTPREILQRLGTDVARNIYPNIWVWNVMKTLDHLAKFGVKDAHQVEGKTNRRYADVVFVTDVRFPNELKALKESGATMVRLERPGHVIPQHNHPSETALDKYLDQFNYVFACRDIEELSDAAHRFALQLASELDIIVGLDMLGFDLDSIVTDRSLSSF